VLFQFGFRQVQQLMDGLAGYFNPRFGLGRHAIFSDDGVASLQGRRLGRRR
jgi:hypothetical protein